MDQGPHSTYDSTKEAYFPSTFTPQANHPRSSTSPYLYNIENTSPPRTAWEVFWSRLRGDDQPKVTWARSFVNLVKCSWFNIMLVFIPLSWISHFAKWDPRTTFALSFLALMPLEHLFEYGGHQMSFYLGHSLGDLVIITLKNAVEAALGLVLLLKCELKLLQASIAGFILLQLLLVPGAAFLAQGAKVLEQDLQPHITNLNQSLLIIGLVSLLLPATFFSSIGGGTIIPPALTPSVQYDFLRLSRGLAVMLLIVYIGARIYLHNPPGVEKDKAHPQALHVDSHHKKKDPELNPWFCIVFLTITVGIMGFTAEWLVYNLKGSVDKKLIYQREEFFGLVILPLASFSGDAVVCIVTFVRHAMGKKTREVETLAEARPIDMSVQFVLFWLPLFVLIAWMSRRAFYMLLDMFEVAVLFGAGFLVNYVVADTKTNWAEGLAMVVLYFMIATTAWYYPGQDGQRELLSSCAARRYL